MDIQQQQFFKRAYQQAEQSGHIFPAMAAAEACLESAYGTSGLAISASNLFGTKQHVHPIYGTVNIPTREFLHHEWVTVSAEWVKYPDLAACFADRMATLKRLAPSYPHYAAALAATMPYKYVTAVSESWSTDPNRAYTVSSIYATAKKDGLF